ncbi:MAG: DMT family transporter [Chloroflexi bacterium]|nr:DMT family transporter [Chloroflexota bacterium]
MKRPLLIANLCAAASSVLLGGNIVGIKIVVIESSVMTAVVGRVLTAVPLALLLLALHRGALPRPRRADLPRIAVLGALGYVGPSLFIPIGLQWVSASVGTLLTPNAGLFTLLLAAPLLGERLTRRKLGGAATAICGIVVVAIWGSPGATFEVRNALGAVMVALGPVAFACHTVLCKPLLRHYGAMSLTAYSLAAAGAMALPAVPFVLDDLPSLDATGWVAVVYIGLIATAGGGTLFNWALTQLEASHVSMYQYVTPITGVVLAAALLGDRVTPLLGLGGAMILAGVGLATSGRGRGPAPPRGRNGSSRAAQHPSLARFRVGLGGQTGNTRRARSAPGAPR